MYCHKGFGRSIKEKLLNFIQRSKGETLEQQMSSSKSGVFILYINFIISDARMRETSSQKSELGKFSFSSSFEDSL